MPKTDKVKKAPMQYDNAKEAQEILERLIPKYHPHLAEAKIKCLFRSQPVKKAGGKLIIATAEKCNTKIKFLTKLDFIISICFTTWKELTDKQRIAVIDHELCHCVAEEDEETGEITYKTLSHDVEEFREIINRRGFWSKDLEEVFWQINKKKSS